MLIKRFADDVRAWAPAKVNLHLEVLGKRPDGYHEIETLMVAVNLCDELIFNDSPAGDLKLRCNREALAGSDNLVMRAAELLRSVTGCTRGAYIRLHKRIPIAAGLAGGSTDAAATLAGLNLLWELNLPNERLQELSSELGSDLAFFFHTPAAWCTGRGEIVTPVPFGCTIWLVLLCPPFGLKTAEVYGKVTVPVQPRSGIEICQALTACDEGKVGSLFHNRLQDAAVNVRHEVADYLGRLERLKPAGACMSGSGSTLFALGRDRRDAMRIAQEFRNGQDKWLAQNVYLVRSW